MSVTIDVGREKVQLQGVRMQKRKVVTVRQTWNRPKAIRPKPGGPKGSRGQCKGKEGPSGVSGILRISGLPL
jgi:hypothetical protein